MLGWGRGRLTCAPCLVQRRHVMPARRSRCRRGHRRGLAVGVVERGAPAPAAAGRTPPPGAAAAVVTRRVVHVIAATAAAIPGGMRQQRRRDAAAVQAVCVSGMRASRRRGVAGPGSSAGTDRVLRGVVERQMGLQGAQWSTRGRRGCGGVWCSGMASGQRSMAPHCPHPPRRHAPGTLGTAPPRLAARPPPRRRAASRRPPTSG
jgi:hypothetical protein